MSHVPLPQAAARLVAAHPLIPLATVLVAVCAPLALLHDLTPRTLAVAFAFGGLIFCGELVRVALPGNREAAPVATAAALGYALLGPVGQDTVDHDVVIVVTVTAVASCTAALVHAAVGRMPRLDAVARRVLVTGFTAGVFALVRPELGDEPAALELVLVMVAIAAVAGLLDIGFASFDRFRQWRTRFVHALRDEFRSVVGLAAAIAATGVLIPLAAVRMDLWALPALSVPLFVAQFSFRRYASIRKTYDETIRALSRITEVGGYVGEGHAKRVTDLSLAIGRRLGMDEEQLRELEYAALLHDVGQISLDEPIPEGSTIAVTPLHRARVAQLGAEIIRSSGFLDGVATIVERQADPYRRNRRPPDGTLPLASRIIKAVSAYDDLVAATPGRDAPADALERLRLGLAYEYDPRVVEALAAEVAPAVRV